jgi:hypothetical protein
MAASDEDLKAIKVVTYEKGKVKIAYDPDMSFEQSPWKAFFKDKADYLKTTGWNGKKFKNEVVYKASHFDRKESDMEEICINLTNKRGGKWANKQWRCAEEKH